MFETKRPLDVVDGLAYSTPSSAGAETPGRFSRTLSQKPFQSHPQNHEMDEIPVFFAGRYRVGSVPLEQVEHIPGGIVVRNKRGNIKRVNLIALVAIVQTGTRKRYGRHIMQHLDGFSIHALSGTIGDDGKKYIGSIEILDGSEPRGVIVR